MSLISYSKKFQYYFGEKDLCVYLPYVEQFFVTYIEHRLDYYIENVNALKYAQCLKGDGEKRLRGRLVVRSNLFFHKYWPQ